MQVYHSDIRTYVVGIQYDSPDEDKGFIDIRRTVSMEQLAREEADYLPPCTVSGQHSITCCEMRD